MAKGTRKKYSKEFKLDAVSLVLDQGYSREEAARSLDIRAPMPGRRVRGCCELKIKQKIYSSLVVYIVNYQQLTLKNYTFIIVFLLYFPGSQQPR